MLADRNCGRLPCSSPVTRELIFQARAQDSLRAQSATLGEVMLECAWIEGTDRVNIMVGMFVVLGRGDVAPASCLVLRGPERRGSFAP